MSTVAVEDWDFSQVNTHHTRCKYTSHQVQIHITMMMVMMMMMMMNDE